MSFGSSSDASSFLTRFNPYESHVDWQLHAVSLLPKDCTLVVGERQFPVNRKLLECVLPMSRDELRKGIDSLELSNPKSLEVAECLAKLFNGEAVRGLAIDHAFQRSTDRRPPATLKCVYRLSRRFFRHFEGLQAESYVMKSRDMVFRIPVLAVLVSPSFREKFHDGVLECDYDVEVLKIVSGLLSSSIQWGSVRSVMAFEDIRQIANELQIVPLLYLLDQQSKHLKKLCSALEELAPEVDLEIKLQNRLMELTEANFDAIAREILDSHWVSNTDFQVDLVNNIAIFVTNPRKFEKNRLFARLLARIKQEIGSSGFREIVRRRFVCEEPLWHFRYDLFQECVFDLDDILDSITIRSRYPFASRKNDVSLPIAWVLPELGAEGRIPRTLPERHLREIVSFMDSDWAILKRERAEHQNSDSVALIIARDDVDSLKKLFTDKEIRNTYRIPECPFDNVNEMALIKYAAYRGSLECVKYLLSQGSFESTWKWALQGAVFGESVEVFDFLLAEWDSRWAVAKGETDVKRMKLFLARDIDSVTRDIGRKKATVFNGSRKSKAPNLDISFPVDQPDTLSKLELLWIKASALTHMVVISIYRSRIPKFLQLVDECGILACHAASTKESGSFDLNTLIGRTNFLHELLRLSKLDNYSFQSGVFQHCPFTVLQKLAMKLYHGSGPTKTGSWDVLRYGTTESVRNFLHNYYQTPSRFKGIRDSAWMAARSDVLEIVLKKEPNQPFSRMAHEAFLAGTALGNFEFGKFVAQNVDKCVFLATIFKRSGCQTFHWNCDFLRGLLTTGMTCQRDISAVIQGAIVTGDVRILHLLQDLGLLSNATCVHVDLSADYNGISRAEVITYLFENVHTKYKDYLAKQYVKKVTTSKERKEIPPIMFEYAADDQFMALAIKSGSIERVKEIVSKNRDIVNQILPSRVTPLVLAICCEYLDIVHLLLDMDNLKLDQRMLVRKSVFVYAASRCQPEVLKRIVELKGGVIPRGDRDSALIACIKPLRVKQCDRSHIRMDEVKNRALQTFRYLCALGPPPYGIALSECFGKAVASGNDLLIKELFSMNVKLDSHQLVQSLLPLLNHRMFEFVDMIFDRLDHTNVNMTSSMGKSVLMDLASRTNTKPSYIEKLVNIPGFDAVKSKGYDVLAHAACSGDVFIVQLLLDSRWLASTSLPLTAAIRSYKKRILSLFLDNIDKVCHFDLDSAIHESVSSRRFALFQYLFNIYAKDEWLDDDHLSLFSYLAGGKTRFFKVVLEHPTFDVRKLGPHLSSLFVAMGHSPRCGKILKLLINAKGVALNDPIPVCGSQFHASPKVNFAKSTWITALFQIMSDVDIDSHQWKLIADVIEEVGYDVLKFDRRGLNLPFVLARCAPPSMFFSFMARFNIDYNIRDQKGKSLRAVAARLESGIFDRLEDKREPGWIDRM